MRALYLLVFVIQFTFAFHALKTGRGARWIVIIFMAPVIGSLLYYFLEVFPNSSEERILRRRMRAFAKTMSPDAEMQRRARELAINPSVENRCKLAEELAGRRMYDDALRLYESCLEGPYAKDKMLLKRVEDTRAARLAGA